MKYFIIYILVWAPLWLWAQTTPIGGKVVGRFDEIYLRTPKTGEGSEKLIVWDEATKGLKVIENNTEIITIPGGSITRVPNVGTSPGTNLTAEDWILNTFYPFVPATITLSSNTLYEVGTTNIKTLSISITSNSETIFTSGYVNRITPTPIAAITSWETTSTPPSVSVTFTPTQGILDSLSKIFQAYQLVGNNNNPTIISSNAVTLSSCYPYFYGMSSNDLSAGGIDFYNAFSATRIVKNCATTTSVSFNSAELKYAYFAFPATCSNITQIKDQNNYDWTNAFTKYEVTISGPNWAGVSYKLYKSNNLFITSSSWTFTFTQ